MIEKADQKVIGLFKIEDDKLKKIRVKEDEKISQKLQTLLGLATISTFSRKFLVNITILKYNNYVICKRISSYGISAVNNIFKNYDEENIQAIRIDIWNKDYPKRSYILFKL